MLNLSFGNWHWQHFFSVGQRFQIFFAFYCWQMFCNNLCGLFNGAKNTASYSVFANYVWIWQHRRILFYRSIIDPVSIVFFCFLLSTNVLKQCVAKNSRLYIFAKHVWILQQRGILFYLRIQRSMEDSNFLWCYYLTRNG